MDLRDAIVVGGGPAGYAAAIRLAQLGKRASLVEKEILGGTCLNRGCIPTMVLAKAAELLEQTRGAKDFGITFSAMDIDFEKLSARRKMVTKIHVGGVKSLLDAYGVETIAGSARFLSPREIEVAGADGKKRCIAGRKVIVATGATEAPSHLAGDSSVTIDTARLLELPAVPPSLVILGGTSLGLTFATIFTNFGSKVTIVEGSSEILPDIDQEIVDMLGRELKKSKIQVLTGARVVRVGKGQGGETEVEIETGGETTRIAAAYVVRTERQPNTDGLGLAEIGVTLNERGGIGTDPTMETAAKSVFAAGDVTMNHLSTPVAYAEGLTAAENAAGGGSRVDYSAVPRWANTIPPISSAGMTEREAIASGREVRVGRFPMAANGMATILGRRAGMIKVVTDARYGEILGVHLMGQGAPELINEALLAMKSELTAEEIGAAFHVHPSLSESLWDVMRAVSGASINSVHSSA